MGRRARVGVSERGMWYSRKKAESKSVERQRERERKKIHMGREADDILAHE